MKSVSPSPLASSAAAPAFPLLWTVGLSGHRELPDESMARAAVREELASLKQAASDQHAQLTAVSSLALGADLLFAEECLAAGLPWKCLLPFALEEFRKDGFSEVDWARAERCLSHAYRVEITSPGLPADDAARKLAYLDCGHRTVEAADVMLLLWNGEPAAGIGGTGDLWEYTRTLNKPVWHWHSKTGLINRVGWPGSEGDWKERRLFQSRLTPLVKAAEASVGPEVDQDNPDEQPTASGRGLWALFTGFDRLANQKQGDAQGLMQRVVLAHLLATTAAALSVTVITHGLGHRLHELPWLAWLAAVAFSSLVIAKPVLAALALHWDRQLHKLHAQKHWVEARVAAELCRSALACWRMPQAPLRVFEEEDFPRFKRLIRTLRMAREMDVAAGATPSDEAAVQHYLANRIVEQADYFTRKHEKALHEHDAWQRKFNLATGFVIVVGGVLGLAEAADACCAAWHLVLPPSLQTASHLLHLISPVIACLLIVAPFYATYALAMLAIRDCRRRRDRFLSMSQFLQRQRLRLARSRSAVSRMAVVENTERMLLEELHEWHSVALEVRV